MVHVFTLYCALFIEEKFDLTAHVHTFLISKIFFIVIGYSAAALLAIIFAIPFAIRVLIHKDTGRWQSFFPAFYSTHLELFLGNACLGVGVLMLLILTVERYVSVCHPSYMRPIMGPPR